MLFYYAGRRAAGFSGFIFPYFKCRITVLKQLPEAIYMNYQEIYSSKLCTADQVAAAVESGWRLGMDAGPAQTPKIISALCDRAKKDGLTGVMIHNMLDSFPFEFYADNALDGIVNGISWFSSAGSRKAVNGGYGDLIPTYYRDAPAHIRECYEYDAFCIAVSPMDSHGYFSMGAVASYAPAMLDKAKRIFVEVNENQPRCVCGPQIHVSQVDAIVENNMPMPTLKPVTLDDKSITIGNLIAEQIPDGACIQLGIGAIPDATGMALMSKHDLGIHSEMFTDSMVDLLNCGAANNSKKQIHRGKTVATFAMGSQKIYDFINDNPCMEILPVEYVNDPAVIAQNDNMISINAAIEVDIFGQVCAESIGTKHMSGTGGQVDFVRGACRSRGGKSFIAFTSTTKGLSKVKNTLTEGAICTTSKNDVDYLVTEYGIAHLRGEPISSRAKQIIAIAHPDFRDELTFLAKKRGIII